MRKKKSHNKGNSFALKWSLDEIDKKLKQIEKYIKEDPKGSKITYIGEMLAENDLYTDAWKYFERALQSPIDCNEDEESEATKKKRTSVFRLHKKISEIMQSRMIVKAMAMKASTPLTIFILKNQGMSDQQNIDLTSDGEKMNPWDLGDIKMTIVNSNDAIKLDDQGNVEE